MKSRDHQPDAQDPLATRPWVGIRLGRSMRSNCTLLLTLCVVHALPMSLSAQEAVQVSGAVSCADCVITLDTIVTIGGLDGPGLHVVTQVSHIAVDRHGLILITESGQSEISVFDSTGKFLRTVGRPGEGPGEYRSISHLGVGPRYIHVFERQEGRTMLDHDFIRTGRPQAVRSSPLRSIPGLRWRR